MEAHLHRAIEFGELQVHFQPQIELETNRIDSFEALVRWKNKKFGAVPPSQFIPLAESSGLIINDRRLDFRASISVSKRMARAWLSSCTCSNQYFTKAI